ncbi:MAG: hypothetical protein AAGC74_10455 [Verrucomicrobiota bacterium]
MSINLYTFVGATNALHQLLGTSTAPDKDPALAASAPLQSAATQVLAKITGNTTQEVFHELLDEHVVTILESIEQIRVTQAYQALDTALIALIDDTYALADFLMGGGGCDLNDPNCYLHYNYNG